MAVSYYHYFAVLLSSRTPVLVERKTSFHGMASDPLLITKFLSGLSAVSTPLAGIIRMRLSLFLFFDCMGVILWVGSFMAFGYLFSEQLDRALVYAASMGNTLFILVAGVLSIYILRKYSLRRRFLRQLFVVRVTPEELKNKLDSGEDIMIIDVCHSLDFESDPYIIPGALRIPSEQLEIQSRQRGITRVRSLVGGFHAWRDRGYPVERVSTEKSQKELPNL